MAKPKSPGGEIMVRTTTHITEAGIDGVRFASFTLDRPPAPADAALVQRQAFHIGWRVRVRGQQVTLTKL